MQATSTGGTKLDKRYSPSFRDDPSRKQSTTKRKRDDVSVLRLVTTLLLLFTSDLELCTVVMKYQV